MLHEPRLNPVSLPMLRRAGAASRVSGPGCLRCCSGRLPWTAGRRLPHFGAPASRKSRRNANTRPSPARSGRRSAATGVTACRSPADRSPARPLWRWSAAIIPAAAVGMRPGRFTPPIARSACVIPPHNFPWQARANGGMVVPSQPPGAGESRALPEQGIACRRRRNRPPETLRHQGPRRDRDLWKDGPHHAGRTDGVRGRRPESLRFRDRGGSPVPARSPVW